MGERGTTGRVALVTGASAGIGRACADRLHRAGWQVLGASRRAISSGGWPSVTMDVDDDDSVAAAMGEVVRKGGRLDAVVAAAGWGLAGPVEFTAIEQAKAQLETNFFGAVRVVQGALGVMRGQGGGRLVLIGSIGGVVALPFQAFYSASKFALEGYAEALAYEVAPFGVEVTVVQPGNVRTDFTDNRRAVEQPEVDRVYPASQKAISLMERDERRGIEADRVAGVVERTLRARRPPRRVAVGRWGERIGIPAKRLLPSRVFERAARGSLGV
jgi:NAD(P)-dependent dehydrogenase (short-subunit alcohol dehydrogenase family)